MANSKDGQIHKDKYLDTCTEILTQKMLMYNMIYFSFYYEFCLLILKKKYMYI